MCGIAGYFGLRTDKALLERMSDAQAHRGPDGYGYFAEKTTGLGHRRLAIIDRAHNQEPMFSPDKNLVVTYNGEIYNYKELRSELETLGFAFNTQSDTEVILQAYAAWGVAAFDRFNGMFAFAIYDRKANKLVLARDHFGIKPLYFTNLDSDKKPQVLFASEIKALLASKKLTPKPNDRAVYRYLRFRIHDESPETFFSGIYKLMAGEYMILDASGMTIDRFTKLPEVLAEKAKKPIAYTPEQTGAYKKAFTESVRVRLMSEVPVGTCLSGGLDSSAVTLTMNELFYKHDSSAESIGTVQNTFSAVFPGSINDEEKYVDAVVDRCKGDVKVYKVYPTVEVFKEDLADFVRTQEEPTISSAQYAQWKTMQEAAKHVTVLLDGQGADEMLTGYYAYFLVYLRQLRTRRQWGKLAWELITSADILLRAARFRIIETLSMRRKVSITSLLNTTFAKTHKAETYGATPNDLRTRFIEDIFFNSLPALLRYEDRSSMRFSLEGRVPFLDKEVTTFLFSLDDEAIIKNGWNKRIVRDALKDLLPPMIHRRRNKVGFTTPEVEWFKKLAPEFTTIFGSKEFAARPYFDQKTVLAEFNDFLHDKSRADSMMFWRLLNIELWLREFIDTPQKSN
ncbi:MAG TPA: asparagine synthase (glutamine-hydrolyzing) [Magnetospirillaceae bacterium]|nr:asparagine synthase (glutamine-hydrolyzing) [Magnetospirillaceae bacterium]